MVVLREVLVEQVGAERTLFRRRNVPFVIRGNETIEIRTQLSGYSRILPNTVFFGNGGLVSTVHTVSPVLLFECMM